MAHELQGQCVTYVLKPSQPLYPSQALEILIRPSFLPPGNSNPFCGGAGIFFGAAQYVLSVNYIDWLPHVVGWYQISCQTKEYIVY